MSSSGLIYAVIVGAWAAYLVPMWLRRQDELNEARPTERFSTAIRLLSGRAALERRASRSLEGEQPSEAGPAPEPASEPGSDSGSDSGPDFAPWAGTGPGTEPEAGLEPEPEPAPAPAPVPFAVPGHPVGPVGPSADSRRRAALLARRRRMVILLFAVFTLGMIAAAVGGVSLLWLPAVPAVLFSLYISHLRRQERRRFEVKLDRRRAAEAAQRVRERERQRRQAAVDQETQPVAPRPADLAYPAARTAAGAGALIEAADTEEWSESPHGRSPEPGAGSWDPVPVPLPTYVTAPVAPRRTSGLDLGGSDTWSAGRAVVPPPHAAPRPPSTQLFDQYAEDGDRPRAVNE